MTEERSCGTCGHYVSDRCVRPDGCCFHHSKWQPIAQEKKTMENKVIFESVKSFCDFWFTMLGVAPFPKEIEKAQKEGYIRKSAVEEAEEIIEKIKNFWEKHDQPYELVLKELASFEIAINQLKSENERLKK